MNIVSAFKPGTGGGFNGTAGNANGNASNNESKFISPTLKLGDPSLDALQFQQDKNSASHSTRNGVSQRLIHPLSLDSANEVNYKIDSMTPVGFVLR
ncbi:hypothetical protein QCA50_009219 [Cerrena zonata]|uniref:Uncharacterized protein n=1 Tax=Cerrena zonata TaxID=2478898 RepID=A0AAW0GB22_9APHY